MSYRDLAHVTRLSGTDALEMLESIQAHMGLLADRELLKAYGVAMTGGIAMRVERKRVEEHALALAKEGT